MSTDIHGRPWATVADTQAGSYVIPDGDFDCMTEGDPREVHKDIGGLYCHCTAGKHYLEGQLDDNGGQWYVGLYPGVKL